MLEKIGLPAKPAIRGSNWVVDASHCQGCSSQFTFINRKHHCRRCGGLFCSSCTQQRMVLRGQGDSPVRICEPCKKLEEAVRFEMRHGHKNRAGRGGSKMASANEDDIIKKILGSDKKESVSSRDLSTTNMDSRIQRDTSSASCSNIQEVTTADEEEEMPGNLSVEESSPEEMRQQALDEKKKYKILKGEGKSEEALRAFKRGKELERQAAALELFLRKNRKRALSLRTATELEKIDEESSISGRKSKISPEKDDLASELKELGWSDMDLHDSDKKPATISLEGELSTLLREVSQKGNTETGSHGIDKSQVLALKKKALMLKREGKLGEAKEELKKAKVLEKKLEEEEFLAEAEDSDDELSALMRSIGSDKQDTFSVAYKQDVGFDFGHILGQPDDMGVDSNFEVTDEDMDDPQMDAALKSLGWTDEANHFEGSEEQFVPINRETLSIEIQSLKREALNQKRAGNNVEALELLKKAKALEKDLNDYVTKGDDSMPHNPAVPGKGSALQSAEKASNPKLAPKSRVMVQKELLALKKRALALRREGRLEEADEELKKGKVLEQQLEEMDNASNAKAPPVNFSNKNADNVTIPDLGDVIEGDVTDQDMNDPTYLSLLSNLGWNEETDNTVEISSKPAKQAASSLQFGASRRSKSEIQRELLGLKRKALAFRRQGDSDGAEEVLEMAKALEAQLEEMELPKKVAQSEIINDMKSETISSSHKIPVEGDEISKTAQEKSPERIASISIISDHVVIEDMGSNEKITHEREETVLRNETNDQSTIRQEILILKRKAVALKREGKMAEARDELKKAKLLEKSLEDKNALPVTSPGLSSSTPNITEEHASSNLGSKPVSSRDRFKLQQESLTHKRLAMKLRREGRMEEAEAEFQLAKALETQLEDLGSSDSVKSSVSGVSAVDDDVGIEDFLDPQLLSALKAIGFDDHMEPEPIKSVATKGENSGQERMKLEEQIKVEKMKAVNLKRAGKQTEALDALRRAKALEKKMNSLAS